MTYFICLTKNLNKFNKNLPNIFQYIKILNHYYYHYYIPYIIGFGKLIYMNKLNLNLGIELVQ